MNAFTHAKEQMSAAKTRSSKRGTIPLPVILPDEDRIDVAKLKDALKDCLQSNSVCGLAKDIGVTVSAIYRYSTASSRSVDTRIVPKLIQFFGEEILT